MYFSKYSRRTAHLLVLAFLLGIAVSCQKDHLSGGADSKKTGTELPESAAIAISYDVIVSTFLIPENPDDAELLSPGERALASPIVEGSRVKQFINRDGTIDGEIQRMDLEGMPRYPEPRIGGPVMPKKYRPQRIVIEGGASTSFNAEGEIISHCFQGAETAMYFQRIADELSEGTMLSGEEFDYMIEGFDEAGFDVSVNSQDNNIVELAHEFEDARRTVFYLDKTQQRIRARAHYDAEGQLETLSEYVFEPGEPAVLTAHRFVTFYDAPRNGVRMGVWKTAQFRNFELEKNL
ncbi:hypothetical protein [Phaeodactylibacter xiamenensis]|uniref:hypothetical protein n=1 Tax=Phaeodactylibacter xiamenensis TaxID=1524460 RepID=UPI003BA97681